MLPIILIVSQKPVELECFGGISGLPETFKKVRYLNHQSNSIEKLEFYTVN